ncbi:MAG: N-acetylmuramoyl-L-alanine amidase family protein [Bacillota bacterium]
MKKAAALVLIVVILMSGTSVYALKEQQLILHMDGKQVTYKAPPVTIKLDGKVLNSDVPAVIINDRTLVPIRIITESTGASVDWDGQNYEVTINTGDKKVKLKIDSSEMDINGNKAALEVPAKLINDRTMVPVRAVTEVVGLDVGWDNSTYTVLLTSPKADILDMRYDSREDAIILNTTGDVAYRTMFLQEPDRLVIDFQNTVFRSDTSRIDVDRGNMIRVRASQFEVNPNISRVVIDLTSPSGYSIDYDEDAKQIKIRTVNTVNDIHYVDEGDRKLLVVGATSRLDFETMTLQQPDRIVVDMFNTRLGGMKDGSIPIARDGIRSVRFSQFEENTVRTVIDLDHALQYNVESSEKGLRVFVDGFPLQSIEYVGTGWKTGILSIDMKEKVEYSVEYDKNERTVTVEIPDKDAFIEEGEVLINNGVVDRIVSIPYDSSEKAGYIVVYLKEEARYKVASPNKAREIVLELSAVPSLYQDTLIVIDPGHGGGDPGANHGGVKEKDINIDVSHRLRALLEDLGFRTLMIREDDSFVDLYERAGIANAANADLYISVHANAHETNSSIYGVETLYYPSEKSELDNRDNYTLAKIIQQELLRELKTADRGLIPRPNLVVTRETKMPAVIAELGFLTNSNERALLVTEGYRQRCAQALSNGIVRYVNEILLTNE